MDQSDTDVGIMEGQSIPNIQIVEVLEKLRELANGKAPEPDGIANEILKVIIKADPASITLIFN